MKKLHATISRLRYAKFEARSTQMQLLATSIGFSAYGIIGKDMVVPPSSLLLTDVVQSLRLHENRPYNTPRCLPQNNAAGNFQHQE